jgi:hypothetical protein
MPRWETSGSHTTSWKESPEFQRNRVKWGSFGLSALRIRKSMTMLNRLNCIKITTFQFDFQSGNQRRVRCVGDDSHVGFVQQFPDEKIKCESVRCHDAIASSFVAKFRGEVLANFYAVAVKRHSSMRNWLSSARRIPCQQPSISRKRLWTCSRVCSSPVSSLSVSISFHFLYTAHTFFSDALVSRCAQNLMLFLCQISRNLIRPDTRLQANGRKKSTVSSSCLKLSSLTPKIC